MTTPSQFAYQAEIHQSELAAAPQPALAERVMETPLAYPVWAASAAVTITSNHISAIRQARADRSRVKPEPAGIFDNGPLMYYDGAEAGIYKGPTPVDSPTRIVVRRGILIAAGGALATGLTAGTRHLVNKRKI